MLKRLLVLAIITTAVAVGVGLYAGSAVTQETDPGTLDGIAAQVLAQGKSEFEMVTHDFYDSLSTLDAALSRYSIIEATPISRQSYILDQYDIGTWYKFRINRFIKQNPIPPCIDCSATPDPPQDMMPLNADEMMVIHGGGVQVVNGVTIYVTVPDFPDFNLNQKYLLFVDYDPSKKVAMVSVGPPGVYFVDNNGNLAHIYHAEPDDPIGSGLAANYGNNVNQLNYAFNPPPPPTPTPPPPQCDPYQEQSCWNRGGNWDYSLCYCNDPSPCGGGDKSGGGGEIRYVWDCY